MNLGEVVRILPGTIPLRSFTEPHFLFFLWNRVVLQIFILGV